jgi:hypothetical protein
MRTVRIGGGAGYSGDRLEPAVLLAEQGKLDYLVLECLAERTIMMAQLGRRNGKSEGYSPFLEERMTALLPFCQSQGLRIITNIGAANPEAAMRKTTEIAQRLGLRSLKIVALIGSDVLPQLAGRDLPLWERGTSYAAIENQVISADAYLGVEQLLPALQSGADVVITGRVADPSLVLAPLVHEFGWQLNDWHKLGQGTAIGHILECSAQVTGGYFADPGKKDVPDLAHIGYPIAEIAEDGTTVISKLPGTGGLVSLATVKEQLLYEIHDPANYLTPDVTADFTTVQLGQIGPDQVEVKGGSGKERPQALKVTVGLNDGYVGEGSICYAGTNAVARARLAEQILKTRFEEQGLLEQLKFELFGLNALHGAIGEASGCTPYEVMLRVAIRTHDLQTARLVENEVEALWLCGPGGGGGARKSIRPVVSACSLTIPRNEIQAHLVTPESAVSA